MSWTPRGECNVPEELRRKLSAMVEKYKALGVKEKVLKRRMRSRTEPIRVGLADLMALYERRFTRVIERRRALASSFLRLWDKHFPDLKTAILPNAKVTKRKDVRVEVVDKQGVIDALDRLDRLDLVDQVIDEKGLRQLAREGKLDGLPRSVVKVDVRMQIQAYTREGTKHVRRTPAEEEEGLPPEA